MARDDPKTRYPLPPQNFDAIFPASVTGREPISQLSPWWIEAVCPDHGTTRLPLRLLCAQIGWKVPVATVVSRLRCKSCGGRPISIRLMERIDGDGHTTRQGKAIDLVSVSE